MSVQISGEFPELLPIRESLIKYVFEPNAAKVSEACLRRPGQLALRCDAQHPPHCSVTGLLRVRPPVNACPACC